jgi:hypothetical protein
MGLALMVVALLGAIYALFLIRTAWKRREFARAISTAKWLLIGVGVYLVVLLAVSIASEGRIAEGGEEVRLCDVTLDCSLAASVIQVDRKRTLGNPPREMIADGMYYLVTVKVTSYAADPQLNPRGLTGTVVDAEGRKFQRFLPGERELESARGEEDPFELRTGPTGGTYKKVFVFDLPADVDTPALIVQSASMLDRFVEFFLIGDEDSLFHGRTKLPLVIRKPGA